MSPSLPDYDVIIVGAGPAGTACARMLGEKGVSTLLVDKATFPREKVCGDAVSGKALEVIRSLNVMEKLSAKPHATIRGAIFSSPSGHTFSAPAENVSAHGISISREVLDNVLFEHATKVCQFREHHQVVGLRDDGNRRYVRLADLSTKETKEVSCRMVVGADGAKSSIATSLNVHDVPAAHTSVAVRQYVDGIDNLSDKLEIHFLSDGLPGYFWISPLANGKANVGVGMLLADVEKKKIDLPALLASTMKHPRFAARFTNAQIVSEVKESLLPLGSMKRTLVFPRALLIGDAASLVDPFTGEGVGNALVSAQIAAKTILRAHDANDFSETMLQPYSNELWQTLGPAMDASAKLQSLARHPTLLDIAFKKAAKSPRVAKFISGTLSNEVSRGELANPLNWVKVWVS